MTISVAQNLRPAAASKPYQLEMKDVAIGADGVEDFLWPVAVGMHKPMRDAGARALMSAVRTLTTRDPLAAEALFLLIHHIVVDFLALFQGALVADSFRAAGREPLPPSRGRMLAAILADRPPPLPLILNHLRRGPDVPKRLRAPLRLARDLLIRDGLVRRRLFGPDYKRDIIAVVLDELMAAHARQIGEQVTFRRPSLWFRACSVENGRLDAADLDRCCSVVIESLEAGFRAGSVPMPSFAPSYVRAWISDAVQLTVAHLRGLAVCGTPVPSRLWTGSGGNIWSRILRHAVRRQGGRVWAHDHGAGTGQFLDEWFKNPIEFDTCDSFVSFTPEQAEGLADHVRNEFKVHAGAPELIGLKREERAAAPGRRVTPKAKPTVMLLSSFYFGDLTTHQAFMPDVPFLDWEARVLAKLQEWGFPTLYKPHPLIITRSPLDMAARFGAKELDLPSEQVLKLADVLILPDPSSTAFATALTSDRPAVFIDFGLFRFKPQARALLDKRCTSIAVPLDAANRPQPDWNSLRSAILGAHERTDTGYADRYYGDVYRRH